MIDAEELRSLINFDEGWINTRIFHDPEIYKLEQRKLFARSWLMLAHESQIPKPGDFFTTWMGGDPVIVVRKRDKTVGAFLNACRHRSMRVCRADAGNVKAFTCTYHGWTYGTDGALINVPNLEDGFFNELKTEQWGLQPVGQIETYKGLIFGNWDTTAPTLTEYLGEMGFYLDCLLDTREGGTEVIPGIHKWTFSGNWKLAAEQFTGDNYHASVSHASAIEAIMPSSYGDAIVNDWEGLVGRQFSSKWGHGAGFFIDPTGQGTASWASKLPALAEYWNSTRGEIAARLGVARVNGPLDAHMNVFPNASILTRPINTLRVWQPKDANSFEAWSLTLVDVNAPEEVKDEQRLLTLRTFSGAGLFETDDGENWAQIGENMSRGGTMVQNNIVNSQMGLGHERNDDAEYPGNIGYMPIGENPQRRFYRRWLEMLTADEWPMPLDEDKTINLIARH